jgi:hypothetical protein
MMEAGTPSWSGSVPPERIQAWQAAVIDGRRRVADLERRASYPAKPDPDTVALCEHYRLLYKHGRILKALSYFVKVTPAEMCAISGVRPEMITLEVRRVADRLKMRIETIWFRHGHIESWHLTFAHDRDEVRAVIQSSWDFRG